MNDELERLIKTFKPKAFDDRSIRINEMVGRYRKAQRAVDSKKKNERALARAVKKSTQAERDLERLEKGLLYELSTNPQ